MRCTTWRFLYYTLYWMGAECGIAQLLRVTLSDSLIRCRITVGSLFCLLLPAEASSWQCPTSKTISFTDCCRF